MNSHEANLFLAVMDRIKTLVPEIRYIEQDLKQLEAYEMRPAVSWPCALIDVEDFDFSDAGNPLVQLAEGFVQLRLGLVQYTQSNNLTPANLQPNALRYMDTAEKVINALHGWAPAPFNRLLLRKAVTEHRDDDIRVKVLRFATGYKVNRSPVKAMVARPPAVITPAS